jgi:hypothetical protein
MVKDGLLTRFTVGITKKHSKIGSQVNILMKRELLKIRLMKPVIHAERKMFIINFTYPEQILLIRKLDLLIVLHIVNMTPTLAEETFAVIAPTTTILAKIAVLKFVLSVRKKTIMSIPTLFAWTAENLTNL